ncbi:hypothetical protein LJC19_01810 [Oxalobacter sp. OttesenSCG-928-P03]|nr:hypothetical protein [Oxalobacter sp. OttesenSCG-928-P03]
MNTHTTTNEDVATFRDAFDLCIKPLIAGATLIGPFSEKAGEGHPVIYESPASIRILMPKNRHVSFIFQKETPFTQNEKNLVEQVVGRLHDIGKQKPAIVDSSFPHTSRHFEKEVRVRIKEDGKLALGRDADNLFLYT